MRRSASSSTTSRSGSACASGMPGAPPPRADVDDRPVERARRARRPRSESSSSTAAPRRGRGAPSGPGVATTAASQASSGEDDDVAIRLRPLARGLRRRERPSAARARPCARPPSSARARPARRASARSARAQRDPLERRAAPVAVARGVDRHRLARVAAAVQRPRSRRTAARRSSGRACRSGGRGRRRCRSTTISSSSSRTSTRRRAPSPPTTCSTSSRTRAAASRLVVGARAARRRSGRVGRRDHARRRVADAEQAALALGDDLEANAALSSPGASALEVAQRLPLRLADRLPGRLHGDLAAHRRAPPFFRLTRRGCARGGFGVCGRGRAVLLRRPRPSPACASSASGRRAARARRRRLRHEPPGDEPLADRPQVGRHPVEDETRREARDDGDEDERQDHHDRALRLVHRRAHEVRRRDLRAGVDREQHVARPVRGRPCRRCSGRRAATSR